MKAKILSYLVSLTFLTSTAVFAQGGITASPAKLYYQLPPGTSGIEKLTVINPNTTNLEVGVSLGDWEYDDKGENRLLDPGTLKTSCASWIKILPGSFFTLFPNERKELMVDLTIPENADISIPVHTAMIYLTQLNPGHMKTQNGASLQVSVRMGIKIYHSFSQNNERDIEVINFTDKKETRKDNTTEKSAELSLLEINIENTGKIWLEGKVNWELLNQNTGERTKLPDLDFLSLPGDKRIMQQPLPLNLKKGKYFATAMINYGDKDELKIVELEFAH
jgi:hypothetical protein